MRQSALFRAFHFRRGLRRAKRWFVSHFCRTENVPLPTLENHESNGHLRVTHISAFLSRNAGDTLLPVVLRDLFIQSFGVKKWHGVDVHQQVTPKDVFYYNQDDFIVIGGGGLFLCDTCPNDNSGWQWNCSIDNLNRIRKPIVAFAIGYNRFRGQEEFKPVFTEHINAFVDHAVFVGLRNRGSIEKLKQYLTTEQLKSKLVFQPCMTTLIAKLYPYSFNYAEKEDFIVFNCAFDRQEMRGLDESRMESLSKVAKELSKLTSIKYYSHMPSDNLILPYFEKYSVPYELVEMKTIESIVQNYCKPRLVIGMRGHAQMIPFGCITPILSIVSHDKMQWFLDDIQHPEWGVDIMDSDFENQLLEKAVIAFFNYKEIMQEIKVQQDNLWTITVRNMEAIKSVLYP